MKNVKLIALDLDGTLLNDNEEISLQSVEAIKDIIKAGIRVVPISGRISTDNIVEKTLKPIGIKYFIGENGGVIKDFTTNEILRITPMDIFESVDLINQLERENIFTYFISNEKLYYSTKNITNFLMDTFEEFFRTSNVTQGSLVNVIKDKNIIPEKIGTLLNGPNDVKKITKLKSKYQKILIMQSNVLAVEACSREISKGIALEWICEKLNISSNDVIAIGDSESDISMLKYAGIPVAMENALEEVKKQAKLVIDNNNDDGVGKFLTDILKEIR